MPVFIRAEGQSTAVEIHALSFVLNKVRGNPGIDLQIDEGFLRQARCFRLTLSLLNFFIQHAAVEIIANSLKMPGLFASEKIAGAADFQVAQGNAKAGAEFGKVADSRKTLARVFVEHAIRAVADVGVSLTLTATHAAADLVKLSEAEPVRILHYNGVNVGHVNARLDNRRADQKVKVPAGEAINRFFQPALRHLPVSIGDTRTGQSLSQFCCLSGQFTGVVVEIKDLAAAGYFAQDGLIDNALVILHHIGLNRASILRSFLKQGDIANAGEGHVQSSRDGGRRQCEHINVRVARFEHLLMVDPEALFFVDHEQAQIAELQFFREHAVRADKNVNRTIFHITQNLLSFLSADKARQQAHAQREVFQTLSEAIQMLLGQHGGGDEHGPLQAIHDALEERPEGHFCFAEANIAAEQAIHNLGRLHIGLDFADCPQLIFRLRIGESFFKLFLPDRIRAEAMPSLIAPTGINFDQIRGQLFDGFAGPGLLLFPFRAAQFAEPRLLAIDRDILLNFVEFIDRNIE